MFLEPVTNEEVVNYVPQFDPSKNTSNHDIPIKFIKMASCIISPILTNLFNQCICQATYPDILIIAEIIPTYIKMIQLNLVANIGPFHFYLLFLNY